MSFHKTSLLVVAASLAACSSATPEPTDESSDRPDFRDGSYHYVLGYDDATGEQIRGGSHEVVTFNPEGKREAIDSENRVARLHPDFTPGSDYMQFDEGLTEGDTDWNVFASTWWPQSHNGTAWRWQPGASSDYEDRSDVARLSPLEKYDTLFNPGQEQVVPAVSHCGYPQWVADADNCEQIEHPEITVAGPATAWELQNQGVYQRFEPDSWWGHCNGWASYATSEPLGFPQRDVVVRLTDEGDIVECSDAQGEGCVPFRMADIEGLMTELYFSDQATFSGRRCNTPPDEMERDELGRPTDPACRDLNPGSLHAALTGMMARGADELVAGGTEEFPAFVIDHNYDHEIWNFPIVGFTMNSSEDVTAEEAQALVGGEGSEYQFNAAAERFVRVELTYRMISDSVGPSQLLLRADRRALEPVPVRLNYVLELDAGDQILGGEWIENPSLSWQNSKELHPDFMWKAIAARGYGEGSDDLGGTDDNPFIAYSRVQAILRCANDPGSCQDEREGGGELVTMQDIVSSVDRDQMERHSDTLAAGTWTFTLSHDPAHPGGDADLYVRAGAEPTLDAYDCRPWLGGSAETCTLELTEPTEVHWMVHGYGPTNAFRLVVSGEVGGGDGGDIGEAWEGMDESGTVGKGEEERFSTGELAAGRYEFTMTGTADADLYVRSGSAPTSATYDCRPYTSSSNETCTVNLGAPSEIHVMVRGYATSSTFELTAHPLD